MHATVHLGLTPIISSPLQISDVCLDGIKGAMVMSTTQYSMDVARVHFIQTTPHYCKVNVKVTVTHSLKPALALYSERYSLYQVLFCSYELSYRLKVCHWKVIFIS